MKTFIATATLSICILSAAHAGSPDVASSVSIQYGDLDLSRVQGTASLYSRVSIAAKSVCRESDPHDRANVGTVSHLQEQYGACIDHAIKAALAQVNRSTFADYVAAKLTVSSPKGIKLASK